MNTKPQILVLDATSKVMGVVVLHAFLNFSNFKLDEAVAQKSLV